MDDARVVKIQGFLHAFEELNQLLVGYFFGEPPHRTSSSMDLAEIG